MFFIIFFEVSVSGVMWLYNAEITNSKGLVASTTVNWLGYFLIVGTYTPMHDADPALPFYIYTFFNLLFIAFAWRLMIETKGQTPDQIEEELIKNNK